MKSNGKHPPLARQTASRTRLSKLLALALCMALALTLLPTTALAAPVGSTTQTFQIGVAIPLDMYMSFENIGTISVSVGRLPSGVSFSHLSSTWWSFEGTPEPGTANNYPITLIDSGDNNTMDVNITVSAGPQTIVQDDIIMTARDIGTTVQLTQTARNGNGETIAPDSTDAPTLEYYSEFPDVAAVDNNGLVTIGSVGTTTVTISSKATPSYQAANPRTVNITINKATPTISADDTTAVLGAAKTVKATLSGAYFESGDSMRFIINSGIVTAPAIVTANGSVSFQLSAADINTLGLGTHTFTIVHTDHTVTNVIRNNTAAANATFDLTITGTAPAITSANNYTCAVGDGGTFQVTAAGNPNTFTYSLTGAPAGVTINSKTGLITVAKTVAAKTFKFTVNAANGVTPLASQAFTLTVEELIDASISPTTAVFDKYAPKDVTTTLRVQSYKFKAVICDGVTLAEGTAYSKDTGVYTFNQSWLAGLSDGGHSIVFDMTGNGKNPTFVLTVKDSTPVDPEPADQPNSDALESIAEDEVPLAGGGQPLAEPEGIPVDKPMEPQPGSGMAWWWWGLIALVLLAGIAAGLLYWRKRKHAGQE